MARRERLKRLICGSAEVADGGPGVRFAIDASGDEKGFVVRHMGRVAGFVNRCPHVGTELDWNPGEFFEETGLYLICSTHGALFEPNNGYCVAGPCRGASLQPLEIGERDGGVYLLIDAPEEDESSAP